ncbi:MAG: leucine-rich repeat protein [Agathobacter sp.]|nr:leucine-rich repeat protein [Agathobacter sp.]
MTSKNKLFKSFLLILICVLCFSSVSLVSATELNEADTGVVDVENSTSIMTFTTTSDTEVNSTDATTNNSFITLEAAGDYIRQQMVNRNTAFEVSITLPYDTYMDDGWGTDGNKYLMNEALKHTKNANEGDYIAYSFSRYTVGRNAVYNSTEDTITLTHVYQFTYYNTSAQEAYVTSQITGILQEAGVAVNMSNLEKSRRISQWMIDNVTYNVTSEDATLKYSPYGAAYNGRAVCQGYSLLAYRLFMAAGVDCRMITGTVNGGNHAWILAKMDDGMYYNMDIMYEDTFASVVSSKPFKYLYKGSKNFGDFANHVYIRGNTVDFKCSLFDYDTAEFDATYPTGADDYAPAFADTIISITPPVSVPDNYNLDIDLRTGMNKGGDIIFTINPSGGSGPVDVPVLINEKEHPRFKYLATDVMISENNTSWRPVSVASNYSFSDDNTSAFFLPALETFKVTISIQDYGVIPMQTITKMYTFTVPENDYTSETLSSKVNSALSGCTDSMSDYDKALYLHDWILTNTTWDTTERNIALEGVFLKGKGNSESYARAYQYLLSKCDITSYLVFDTNTIGVESDSVWVCAQLDGQWTFIDIFNDDINNNTNVAHQHIYFGLNSDMLSRLHGSYQASPSHLSSQRALSSATSMINNYYVKEEVIAVLAKPYDAKIKQLVEGTTTFSSLLVETHSNQDVYTLYYPMVADYLNTLTYSKDVSVVYNAKKNTLDVTIAEIDHSLHNLTYSGAKAPTCEEPGWTAQIYCNTCQVLVKESTQIEESGHDWDYYHKCKTCGKFDTTPGNLIYYGAKDDPVRAEYKIVDDNSVQYYKCKAVEDMTDVKVADYIKIGGKVYYVTSMNPNCFADRKDLTSVHVGENITSIGAGVFKDQTELVKVTGFTKVKNIYSKAFYNCTKLQQIGDITNVVNLPLVTEIRAETFFKCRAITTVYGMNKVFSIGDRAFYGCNQLVQIGNTAKCLTLPSISKIGKEAFRYCTSIKTIYSYSTQLTTIGIGAFQDCSNLYSVKISSDKLASVGSDAFKGIASKATFLVHTQNLDSYKLLFSNKVGFKSTMTMKGY